MIHCLAHINKHVKKWSRERCVVLKPNHTCTYGAWDTDTQFALLIRLYTSVQYCTNQQFVLMYSLAPLMISSEDNHIPRFWDTREVTDEWVAPQQHVVRGRVCAVLQLNSILHLENAPSAFIASFPGSPHLPGRVLCNNVSCIVEVISMDVLWV